MLQATPLRMCVFSDMPSTLFCQTSVILRTLSPISLDDGFRHVRFVSHSFSNTPSDSNPPLLFFDSHPLDRECLYFSRAAAVGTSSTAAPPSFVAFPYNDTTVSVVFPAEKKMEMERTLQDSLAFFPIKLDCTADDAFGPGLAMENTLLCGLTAALVRDGWTVLEGNLAVQGGISQWQDGTPTGAVSFAVQTEPNNRIDFVLSPDVIRFRPFEIEKLISGSSKRMFDDGAEVVLDNYLENMSPDDIQEMKCIVIPSMNEGLVSGNICEDHLTGCCKSAPEDFHLCKLEEFWAEKHGLVLPREGFYIRVSFPSEGNMIGVWFPSCLVLKRPGLIPALPTIRKAKIHSVLEKIACSISGWDFFNAGKLKLESHLRTATESQKSCWTTAKSTLQASQSGPDYHTFDSESCISVVSSLEAKVLQNFRGPKPLPRHCVISEKIIEPPIPDTYQMADLKLSDSRDGCKTSDITKGHSGSPFKPALACLPTNLRAPMFSKRKSKGTIKNQPKYQKELGEACTEPGKNSMKKVQEANSKSTACANLEAPSLSKNKKAVVRSQPSFDKQHMLTTKSGPRGSQCALVEHSANIKQDPQDKSSPANTSIKDRAALRKTASKRECQGKQRSVLKKKKVSEKLGTCLSTSESRKPQTVAIQSVEPSESCSSTITSAGVFHPSAPKDVKVVPIHVPAKESVHVVPVLLPEQDHSVRKVAKAAEKKTARGEKLSATTTIDIEANKQKILSKHAEGKLNDLTLPELKCFLSANRTKVSGKKEELVQRVVLLLSS